MQTTYHQRLGEERPKRGDLLQTNVGKKMERTWMILGSREVSTRYCEEMGQVTLRTKIWAERWWNLEPELRMSLWRSAERRGGQKVLLFHRFPEKKRKRGFEGQMGWM